MEKIECCNIWKRECFVIVKDTEELCPDCNGHGASFIHAHYKQGNFDIRMCMMCKGMGKIDWISYITKKYNWVNSVNNVRKISMKCNRSKGCKKIKRLFMDQQRQEKLGR